MPDKYINQLTELTSIASIDKIPIEDADTPTVAKYATITTLKAYFIDSPIVVEQIKAEDGDGLYLYEDGGAAGIHIEDDGDAVFTDNIYVSKQQSVYLAGIADTTVWMGADSSGNIDIKAGTTGTHIHIKDSTGNVGIGTSTVPQRLTVNGSATLSADVYIGGDLIVHGDTEIEGNTLIEGIQTGTEIAIQDWQSTIHFTSTAYNGINWALGAITLADETVYNIIAGSDGALSSTDPTYIKLDINLSATGLRTTQVAADAVGSGRILMAVARANPDNVTARCRFQVFGGRGGIFLGVDDLVANTVSVNEFVGNTANIKDLVVTDGKINTLGVNKLTAGSILSKAITLAVTGGTGDSYIGSGKTDFTNADSGFILGVDDSDNDEAKLYIGDPNYYMNWTGADLIVHGASIGSSIFTGIQSGSEISIQGWQSTILFSTTAYNSISWAIGDITLLDTTVYNIDTGSDGTLSSTDITYIYLDINTSETVLQTSQDPTDAVGSGKIMVVVAKANPDNGASKCQFQAFGGSGGIFLGVDNLAANSVSVNEFISNTAQIKDLIVTDAKINTLTVAKLTSGTIQSKTVTLGVADGTGDSYINSGKTDFTNAGSGFILGVDDSDSNKAKFFIGDPTHYLNWDGSAFTVTGLIQTATSGQRVVIDNSDNTLKFYNDYSTNSIITIDDNGGWQGSPDIDLSASYGGIVHVSYDGDDDYISMESVPYTSTAYREHTQLRIHSTFPTRASSPIGYWEDAVVSLVNMRDNSTLNMFSIWSPYDTGGANVSATTNTFVVDSTGKITIRQDCNLYRNAANVLKTDDGFIVTGALTANGGASIGSITGNVTLSGGVFQVYEDINNYVYIDTYSVTSISNKGNNFYYAGSLENISSPFAGFKAYLATGKTGDLFAGYLATTKKFGVDESGNIYTTGTVDGKDIAGHVDDTTIHYTQANITAVGTVTSGTWSANTIALNKGGTGATSFTAAQLIQRNVTTSVLESSGYVTSDFAPAAGSSSIVTVGTITTGVWSGTVIGITKGGTGQAAANASFNALSPMITTGDMIYYSGASVAARLAVGTSSQVLIGGSIPAWGSVPAHNQAWSTITSTPTTLSGYSIGDAAPLSHVSTTGTVHGATNLNSVGQIVCRDASGNFVAGTITAALSGNASTASSATTATTATQVANALTAGTGLTSGGTFTGAIARTFAVDLGTGGTQAAYGNHTHSAISGTYNVVTNIEKNLGTNTVRLKTRDFTFTNGILTASAVGTAIDTNHAW